MTAMYDLSKGSTKPLKYEDVVVAAWKKYPQNFGLRGYEYPDSSDIHKPLYGPLKNKGFVRTANKFFSLTERGLSHVQEIISKVELTKLKTAPEKLRRDEQTELDRLMLSDAFKLYERGEAEKILDSDFYAFYGVTVRTGKNEFLGRLTTVKEAIYNAFRVMPDNHKIKILLDLDEYLSEQERFKTIIPGK